MFVDECDEISDVIVWGIDGVLIVFGWGIIGWDDCCVGWDDCFGVSYGRREVTVFVVS